MRNICVRFFDKSRLKCNISVSENENRIVMWYLCLTFTDVHCGIIYYFMLSLDNPSMADYLQKCSNAVELNSSLNGTSARNSLHSSSAFSWHSSENMSITQTLHMCVFQLCSHLQTAYHDYKCTNINWNLHMPIPHFICTTRSINNYLIIMPSTCQIISKFSVANPRREFAYWCCSLAKCASPISGCM